MSRQFSIENLNRHRSAIFGGKLSYLNRKHIERKISTPEGLASMVKRIQPLLLEAFPEATAEVSDQSYVEKIFLLLRVR